MSSFKSPEERAGSVKLNSGQSRHFFFIFFEEEHESSKIIANDITTKNETNLEK